MPAACENCLTPLVGPYCAQCGQHAHASARTLRALLHDAWHDLTHIEGRIFETIRLLMMRPGRLTQDYFAGHRARYAPPFRLYLVLSVAFFSLATLTDRMDPETPPAVAVHAKPMSAGETCSDLRLSSPNTQRIVQRLCERFVSDGGDAVSHAFGRYLPKSLFVFLPMVAAVLALVFRRSRRFFVEHLVFVLHNHAAVFTALSALGVIHLMAAACARLGIPWVPGGLNGIRYLLDFVLVAYVPWYTYRSMRVYYGLSRRSTLLRLVPISTAYAFFMGLTFAGTLLISALLA